jgi:flagellar biogenesis protein FliO
MMNQSPEVAATTPGPMKLPPLIEGIRTALTYVLNLGRKVSVTRRKKNIQLCETLSLGDKRFLAVVLVEQQKFLVGGAGNSVALLAKLPSRNPSPHLQDEVHLL